jgi:methyl-accepting chemotaxis protein
MMLIVTVIALLAGIGVAIYLSRRIAGAARSVATATHELAERDLTALTVAMNRVADGDLTATVKVDAQPVQVQSKDELGQMAESYNGMVAAFHTLGGSINDTIANLNHLLTEVTDSADSVTDTSHDTLAKTEQIAAATMQVSSTIQEVARGSAQQAEQVNAVSTAFDQMNQTVDAVAQGAIAQGRSLQQAVELTQVIAEQNNRVATAATAGMENAQRNADRARTGEEMVRRTVETMEDVRQRVDLAAARVAEMGERSQQIGLIVRTIEDVTEQTNLLALNAAIEAARAGDAGKGFAVVAEEVRKLAERSSNSTREIVELVAAVQQSVTDAVTAMDEGAHGVDAVSKETDAVRTAFEGILVAATELEQETREISEAASRTVLHSNDLRARMEDTSAIAEENSAAASEMSQTASQVRGGIQGVSAVIEQNAAAAEEVSAASEETSSQLEQVTISAHSLEELAVRLQQLVARFQLAADAASSTKPVPSAVVPRRRASDWDAKSQPAVSRLNAAG